MWNPFTRRLDTSGSAVGLQAGAASGVVDAEPRPLESSIAEIEMIGHTAVATLTATELTQDDGADRLAELLLNLTESGATHFVLDVQNVRHMDTACVGCLVEALNGLVTRGGRIALANPNHSVHYVFRLTRLDRVFRICPDVMAALDEVEGRREAG